MCQWNVQVCFSLCVCVLLSPAAATSGSPLAFIGRKLTVEPIEDVATRFGYPIERHTIPTEDGYLLMYHRVPYGRNQTKGYEGPRRVVLFINGIFLSSDASLFNANGFPYLMADSGYDVWLGNYRGSKYCRRHTTLDPDRDPQFWDISLHDFGTKDLPAAIDYILTVTGRQKLVYIGASMGTTMFWVLGASMPHYMDRVSTMIAIAPVARPSHATIVDGPGRIKFLDSVYRAAQSLGFYELFPYSEARGALISRSCYSWLKPLCSAALDVFRLVAGEDWDLYRLLESTKYNPAGVPSKVVHHYLQIAGARRFQQYDFGCELNKQRYQSAVPPEYNLKNVAPGAVYFVHSDADQIAVKEDVEWLYEQLPVRPTRLIREVNHLGHFGLAFDKKIYNLWVLPLAKFLQKLTD